MTTAAQHPEVEVVAMTLYDTFHDRIWGLKLTLDVLASASFWREVATMAAQASEPVPDVPTGEWLPATALQTIDPWLEDDDS